MNRAVSGTVVELESGRPIPGVLVVVVRVTPLGLEPLGDCASRDFGCFCVRYDPLPEPADLSLLVLSPTGRLLYTEPVHRSIGGAELRLQVEVPRAGLTSGLH